METKLKRKRGAPIGNQNALKHGYYSQQLSRKDKFDFRRAARMMGVEEEIALLRFEIKKAISNGDIKNLVPLTKATQSLEKLIRTRHAVLREDRMQHLKTAMRNVITEMLIPAGGESAARFLVRQYCPDLLTEENNTGLKINYPQNEAELP